MTGDVGELISATHGLPASAPQSSSQSCRLIGDSQSGKLWLASGQSAAADGELVLVRDANAYR